MDTKTKYYKDKALRFLHRYSVGTINLEKIYDILKVQEYRVVRYNTFEENASVEMLLSELELKEYSLRNKAFTYKNGSIKIVFIDDSLLEEEKLYALVHEEGHIFCGHMERNTCSALNVEDEHEANEFAHYVLNPPAVFRIGRTIRTHKRIAIVAVSILVLAVLIPIVGVNTQAVLLRNSNEYTKTLDYYVTESGEKYHREDCRIIQGKDNVRRITEEEYDSEKYEPCKVCKP